MIKSGKKFQGGKRYYHSHQVADREVRANPDWEQRQHLLRRDRQMRIFRILGFSLLCIGLVVGTFLLAVMD